MTQRAMSMGGYPIEVLTPQDGSGTAINTAQITDATKTGKQLLTAKDAAAARQAIGAKADNYRPKVADISDASAIGRQILAAKDAAAIKALLGL